MKGVKRRNSNSDQIQVQSSSAINGGSDSVAEDDGVNRREEIDKFVSADEGLDEEERDEGGSGDDDDDEVYEQPGEEAERTMLADGFYEIEAVRGKRIRKGKRQYLIKWREWPETENTWEPFENLQQVADVIEAYEDSLKSGKSTRKRKRKPSINHVLPKKKHREQQQRSPASASYSVQTLRTSDDTTTFSKLNRLVLRKEISEVNTNGGKIDKVSLQLSENGVKTVPAVGRGQSEFRGEMATTVECDQAVLPSGESQPTGDETSIIESQKNNEADPIQPGRNTGAKRRKSGSVKRFKKSGPVSCSVNDVQIGEASRGTLVPVAVQLADVPVNNGHSNNKLENPYSSSTVARIIRPISYRASTSHEGHDVILAFEALRSDGIKVTVDNKFLKKHNPLLLIDYYEKNIRYNPSQ